MKRKKNNLRQKKKNLNRQYSTLISHAWQNEIILRRCQQMELCLMQCESFASLTDVLLNDAPKKFELDQITLILLDPRYEIRRLLLASEIDYHKAFPNLFFQCKSQTVTPLFDAEKLPKLGTYQSDLHADYFQESQTIGKTIQSVAALPLVQEQRMLGCLLFGDSATDRFIPDSATDFLQHLGAVISICIDMALLRDRLKYNSLNDALTGINNRRFFEQRLPEEISRCKRAETPISCLFVDVDHFKHFNDTYGHATGDLILKQVASIIRRELRATDVVGRYGGEEFVILLPNTNHRQALDIAERIRKCIQKHRCQYEEHSLQVTVSIGIADFQKFADENKTLHEIGQALVAAADSALYKAKQAGRNRIAINSGYTCQYSETAV
ncbi:MAG: sensor domain-containing diguanylate cyclase [Nitrosomonas sp.]|nr:sensor domain-containing diguanylate cyclase [Nitrosomonas sp.]